MDIHIWPTYLNFFVQTFFLEKVWLRNTLPTYDLDICPNFRSFFIWISLLNQNRNRKLNKLCCFLSGKFVKYQNLAQYNKDSLKFSFKSKKNDTFVLEHVPTKREQCRNTCKRDDGSCIIEVHLDTSSNEIDTCCCINEQGEKNCSDMECKS